MLVHPGVVALCTSQMTVSIPSGTTSSITTRCCDRLPSAIPLISAPSLWSAAQVVCPRLTFADVKREVRGGHVIDTSTAAGCPRLWGELSTTRGLLQVRREKRNIHPRFTRVDLQSFSMSGSHLTCSHAAVLVLRMSRWCNQCGSPLFAELLPSFEWQEVEQPAGGVEAIYRCRR
jgi:hypothetical protein